ncbi:cytosolic endo-beta-N-acetylglucosaminidase [Plutella xylostella]|uniref:cytosolic endo-beta-N-acetylglucosaminidase n=1 Tax=Plutella xylostella TaxID=51655 RepID=UPI0020328B77|nr:cytosolic endo-beta-N-acetylglucosaminidase [Plutella xylostella]
MAIPINELICRPITSYSEIMEFLQNPPPWRSLCEELVPHSEYAIVNASICESGNQSAEDSAVMTAETPPAFCHFQPEAEMVSREVKGNLPKTLVCHDMANGYHDDSFISGTRGADAYSLVHWAGVDVFCYFSHHLVTVPPLGWINAAHRHGVKVIGTVITEWGGGAALWARLLAGGEWRQFASALVAIAKLMKFDGWLLNIENEVKRPDVLLQFVHYLRSMLHAELPHALLVWYDSVTVHGQLKWQNRLNELNEPFFLACDGIFTNYSWREADVAASAARAGARRTDVYVGIDVWGRNFYGGGMFNTDQAVKIAHKHGCSLAIFAPAWTREAVPDPAPDPAPDAPAPDDPSPDTLQQFLLRDRALWGSLWPWLSTRLPARLPFTTSFCRGQGWQRWEYGQVVSSEPWFNLRGMQYQPNSALGPHGYTVTSLGVAADVARGLQGGRGATVQLRQAIVSMESSSDLALENEEEDNTISINRGTIRHLVRKKRAPGIPADATPLIVKTYDRLIRLTENLSLQGVSTDTTNLALVELPDEKECLQVYFEESFFGGSCLQINPSDEVSPEHRLIRLFHCDFEVKDSLIVCVVTKTLTDYPEQSLDLQLLFLHGTGATSRVVLKGQTDDEDVEPDPDVINVFAANATRDNELFGEIQRYLLKHEPDFYVSTENNNDWDVRYYAVVAAGRLASVSLRTRYPDAPVLLGHFGLAHMDQIHSTASSHSSSQNV